MPTSGSKEPDVGKIDNARITRLREKISDRPFEVKWLAGKDNVIADALSRAPAPTTAGSTSMPIRACMVAPQSTITNILDCVKNDKAYQDIIDAFQQGKSLADLNESHPARRLKQVWGAAISHQ